MWGEKETRMIFVPALKGVWVRLMSVVEYVGKGFGCWRLQNMIYPTCYLCLFDVEILNLG